MRHQRYMRVWLIEGSHIYHRDRRCHQLTRRGHEPVPRTLQVRRLGPQSGRWRYRPCHICAVEP